MKEAWAKEIIAEAKEKADNGETWACENCGEEHSA